MFISVKKANRYELNFYVLFKTIRTTVLNQLSKKAISVPSWWVADSLLGFIVLKKLKNSNLDFLIVLQKFFSKFKSWF